MMRRINLGNTGLKVPAVALGCMRIGSLPVSDLSEYINLAYELGIDFFDHADIYDSGLCESNFAEALSKTEIPRSKIILQSKCGIVPGRMYDFSKEYILQSVDKILERLKTDYLDILLLHRPDALMEPEEVAEAFEKLEKSGKVRYFGVSNHRPSQIELLRKYVKQEIIVDQLQFSIPFSGMISSGLEVNMLTPGSFDHDGSVLDYCRIKNIAIQAWSPFGTDKWGENFIDNDEYPEVNKVLNRLAEKYEVSKTTIAAAWVLRHPADIQLITGTTKAERLKDVAKAADIELTREEWYQLYLSAGNILP